MYVSASIFKINRNLSSDHRLSRTFKFICRSNTQRAKLISQNDKKKMLYNLQLFTLHMRTLRNRQYAFYLYLVPGSRHKIKVYYCINSALVTSSQLYSRPPGIAGRLSPGKSLPKSPVKPLPFASAVYYLHIILPSADVAKCPGISHRLLVMLPQCWGSCPTPHRS